MGVVFSLMIIAEQMKKAMHREVGKMVRERLALCPGFTPEKMVGAMKLPLS